MKFTLTIEGDSREELDQIAKALTFDSSKEELKQKTTDVTQKLEEQPRELVTGQGREVPSVDDRTITITNTNTVNPGDVLAEIQNQMMGNDLDDNGMPWDERIHASTKTKNKDGSWKYRRGVSDELKAEVEAELKKSVSGVVENLPANTPQVPPAPVASTSIAEDAAPCVDTAAAFAPPAPPATDDVVFADVAVKLAGYKRDGIIDQAWVDETVKQFDLANFGGFATPDRAEDLQRFNQLLEAKAGQ